VTARVPHDQARSPQRHDLTPSPLAGEGRGGGYAWHRVATLADLKDGEPFPVTVDDVRIALYRIDGAVHAIADICSHEYVRLSGGAFDGSAITCPLHGARFDVATGSCLAGPATDDLATYKVRLDGNEILIGCAPAER
jgi:3-phenylpropionate/trans-cinnamate dioxygenase ferredoxin subunit